MSKEKTKILFVAISDITAELKRGRDKKKIEEYVPLNKEIKGN
jgi:hypothetical protein